jgi:hypothetical protein
MQKIFLLLTVCLLTTLSVTAQEKGVDQQNNRIRDVGNERTTNGTNQTVGSGRGIDFGRGRTVDRIILPNPFRFTSRRDALLASIEELMRERKLILDTDASKSNTGLLVSQPYTFTKGAIVSQSELGRYAELPPANSRGWTRGRYTYLVEVQPIDAVTANVSVNVKIEGRTDGVTGAEWVTLVSNGTAEQEFLAALVEKINGSLPSK